MKFDADELFEEVYYSPSKNKLYIALVYGNRILTIFDDMWVVQWTPQFEVEFEQCILLGDL